MIAKGNLHANGKKLAAYLTTGKEGERAELVELRGFASDNIFEAFTDVQIQAGGTQCQKPFFHSYVRLPEGEALDREKWLHVADRIEVKLGFDEQPRAVAFHISEDGTTHMHMAWSRIDTENMRAIDPGLYKNKLKEVSRELENELGLAKVRNERSPRDKTKSAQRDEFEQSRRLKTNLKEIRENIRTCWDGSANGEEFAAQLDESGYILARGDRRDFVVIDRAGGDHALGKRITGSTAQETRNRLADIDRAALPSVEDAKVRQQALVIKREAELEKHGEDIQDFKDHQASHDERAEQARLAGKRKGHEKAPHEKAEMGEPEPLYVASRLADGAAELLTDYVSDALEFFVSSPPPRQFKQADFLSDPAARREHYAQLAAERERKKAIDRMDEDIKAGKNLSADDVRRLNREDLENIKERGDAHLQDLIRSREKERQREIGGRERER